MADYEKHQYEPLRERGWTRLLKLMPGLNDDELRIKLQSVELHTASTQTPVYEAVSYVWGDPSDNIRINIDGRYISITRNLYHALLKFRRTTPRMLWTDAICIDQENIDERGHQVSQMASIYEGADGVLIWLGEKDGGDAHAAFSTIHEFNRDYGYEFVKDPPDAHLWWEFDVSEAAQRFLTPAHLRSVHILLQQEWFRRIWVLQEVGLARMAVLHWGGHSLAFSELVTFCVCIGRSPNLRRLAESEDPYGQIINTLLRFWSGYGRQESWKQENDHLKLIQKYAGAIEGGPPPLSQILFNYRNFKSTDPRDHIYAFLGHASARDDSNNPFIEADYNKSVEDLNREVTVKVIRKERNLNFLSAVQHAHEDLLTGGSTVSWIPQWHMPRLQRTIAPKPGNRDRDASLSIDCPTEIAVDHEMTPTQLTVRGIAFTTVQRIGPIYSLQDENFQDMQSNASALDPFGVAWNLVLGAHTTTDPIKLLKQLSITLVAGYLGSQSVEETGFEEHWNYFRAYCYEKSLFFPLADTETPLSTSSPRTLLPQDSAAYYDISSIPFKAHQYAEFMRLMCENRRFFTTSDGRFGLGPLAMRESDTCAILFGARVPFVLRPCPRDGLSKSSEPELKYQLVGECFVNEVMTGDIVRQQSDGLWAVADMTLV